MDEKRFKKPVFVMLGEPGEIHLVQSAKEAAECLLHRWPFECGRKYRDARETCITVLADDKDAEIARAAFIGAAKEAGILVETETQSLRAIPLIALRRPAEETR